MIDTSCVLAVVINEDSKRGLIELTEGADLVAPVTLHWEIGNALSAMFRRNRISFAEASEALKAYRKIPIRLDDVDLETAVLLAHDLGIYAYDAYMIACAKKWNCPLLSLDQHLLESARKATVEVLEV